MASTVTPSGFDRSARSAAVLEPDGATARWGRRFGVLRFWDGACFEFVRDLGIAVHPVLERWPFQRLHHHKPGIEPGRLPEPIAPAEHSHACLLWRGSPVEERSPSNI